MKLIRLGRSELLVGKTSMGCLPIQRPDTEEAVRILRRAYEGGINFFDTANAYTDSEQKMGLALSDVRKNIVIATKSAGKDRRTVQAHIENSLAMLRTDYIDLLQFHMVTGVPDFGDPDGPYQAAQDAKKAGIVRHIGVTTHRIELAFQLIETGRFETLQYPFSYLSTEREIELVRRCAELDVGFIAMKALSGGLLRHARAAYAFMAGYDNVVPIWGIQTMEQLEEFLALTAENPRLDDGLRAVIESDRRELSGDFCRGCGYCQPCPAGIELFNLARLNFLLRRSNWKLFMNDEWVAKVEKTKDCINCGVCKTRCPYGLDTPTLIRQNYEDYYAFREAHKSEM
jgi:aryl-alcohol dehydrogenase-like predicted oxidoreductase